MLIYILFVNTYILYIETPRPNTNRHVHAHKCLHCAGIEPATSCVVGGYTHYATSVVGFTTTVVVETLTDVDFAHRDIAPHSASRIELAFPLTL
jgi:hypothetical protein